MDASSPHKDLAFLKALVSEGPKAQKSAGELFLVAGLVYSLQCVLNGLEIILDLHWPTEAFIALGIVPTAIFLGWMFWVMWRNRKDSEQGVATRALKSAFTGAGMANVTMCVVFGWVSMNERNGLIWLLYPAVVSALQGACWYVAYMIRRRLWRAAVSAGWFATAIGLGFLVHDTGYYLLVFAAALFGLMAVPGYMMMRHGKAG